MLVLLFLVVVVVGSDAVVAQPRRGNRTAAAAQEVGAGALRRQHSVAGESSPLSRRRAQGFAQDTSCPVGADAVAANRPMPSGLSSDSLVIEQTEAASRLIRQINSGADGLIINQELSTFRGGLGAAGLYLVDELDAHGAPYCIPRSGIVLSTGDVKDYGAGPSEGEGGGDTFWGKQHPGHRPDPDKDDELLLRRISDARELAGKLTNQVEGSYHDVARLDIYFSIDASRVELELTFDLVFASEEYAAYVGTAFVDAFGIFVNGVNVAEFNGQPLNIDHADMRFFGGTESNGVCAAHGDDPILQSSIPMTGMDCGEHRTADACTSETFGQTGEGCDSSGCDYTVCHWEPTEGICYNTLTYIIADTFDNAVDTTVYIMSLGADVDCAGIEPPEHGRFCETGCSHDACAATGVLLDKNQCVFECDPGYTYEGFVSCRTGSHVSRARCLPDPCIGIDPPSHGSLVGSCEGGQMDSGQECIVRCDDGYEISAGGDTNAVLSCEAGVLSPVVPTCSDYTPPRITCADEAHQLSADGACVTVDPASFIGVHIMATDDASGDDLTISEDRDDGERCFPVLNAQPWYHSLTFVATDQAGLSSSCDVHFFVWHMDCPVDTIVDTDHGLMTTSFELPQPLFRGLSSAVATPVVSIDGSAFAAMHPGDVVNLDLASGQHQLTYTASITSLATATCTMTVTVQDSEPPELFCPLQVVMPAPATFDTAQAAAGNPPLISAADNSGTTVEIAAPPSNIDTQGLPAQENPYTIEFIATEADGLSLTANCSIDIHVWDITCPAPASVGMEVASNSGGGRFILPGAVLTGSWASLQTTTTVMVEGSTEVQTPYAEHFFPTNTATRSYDLSYSVEVHPETMGLNSKSCTSTITVLDDIPPVISCPTHSVSRVIHAGTAIEITAASYIDSHDVTATDNSGVAPTITVTSVPVFTTSAGVVRLSFAATDADMNTASCGFDLQVWSVECPAALTVATELDRSYSIVILPHVVVLPFDLAAELMVDTTITIPGQAGELFPGASVAIDLADSGLSLMYSASLRGAPDDVKTCNVPVTVVDSQPPQLTCPLEAVLLAGDSTALPSASINIGSWLEHGQVLYSDNSGPDNVELSWADGLGDPSVPVVVELQSDPYTLTLTAKDSSQLTDTCDVAVYTWSATCNDVSAIVRPFAQCDPAPCARLNLTSAGPTITGNLDRKSLTITPTIVGASGMAEDISSPFVVDIPLSHQIITYHIEDGAGHRMSCDAEVIIVDDAPPSFDYCPGTRTFQTGSDVSFATFRASSFNMVAHDNSGLAPSITYITSAGIVETADSWTMEVSATHQTVTVEARDQSDPPNRPAVCVISVTVIDTTAPIITCPGPYVRVVPGTALSIQLDSNDFISSGLVSASDNSGEPEITADPTGTNPFGIVAGGPANPGQHSIVFTATDPSDVTQTAECEVPVHVWNLRCNRPAITKTCEAGKSFARVSLTNPTEPPVQIEGSTGGFQALITVKKQGGHPVIDVLDGTEFIDVQLSESGVVLLYTAELVGAPDDPSNNQKTCTMTVTVEDDELPLIECPPNITVLANTSGYGSVSIADLTGEDGPLKYSDNSGRTRLTWQDGLSDLAVPVVFPLQDHEQTLSITVTEAAGSGSATCDVPVYVWSMQCDEVAQHPFVTSAPNGEGQGDEIASVPIPFPTILSMPVGDPRVVAPMLADTANHDLIQAEMLQLRVQAEIDCSGCAEPVSFTGDDGAFLPSRVRELLLGETGMEITYTAISESNGWSDGQTATCVSTIVIEDDEAPTISCPDNIWLQSGNLTDDIALQADLLISEGRIVADDNAEGIEITITTDVQSEQNSFGGSITYTARQSTDRYGERLQATCTVWIRAWDTRCPENITAATSQKFTLEDVQHGGKGNGHASIRIPPIAGRDQAIIRGAVPNQDITITVDVSGRAEGPLECVSISDCGQVTEFPFLPAGGGVLAYRVAVSESFTNGDVVRAGYSTCTTPVTVLDDEDPLFCQPGESSCRTTCESELIFHTDAGKTFATIRPSEFMPEASDNSGLVVEVLPSLEDGYELSLDEHSIVVNFTATDTSGNTAICQTHVRVRDAEAPAFTRCPQSAQSYPMELGRNDRAVVPSQLISQGMIAAVDNSGIEPAVSIPPDQILRSGRHQVTFTATDAAGNVDTCHVTLNVPCAVVEGPVGQNSDWREPPPERLTAGDVAIFKVALKDFYGSDYVGAANVTATFTSAHMGQYTMFRFSAQHLSGNVHSFAVNIPVVGKYIGKVTVTEDGGAEGLVANWPVARAAGEVRPGEWSPLTATVGSLPVVLTAGHLSSSLIVHMKDSLGNAGGVNAAGVRQPLLKISAWNALGWETETETLNDNADGTYSSERVPQIVKAGSYLIDITMNGQRLAVSEPVGLRLIVLPEPVVDARQTSAEGGSFDQADVNRIPWFDPGCPSTEPASLFFDIIPRDRFGNRLDGASDVEATFTVTSLDTKYDHRLDPQTIARTGEHYRARIRGVHATTYRITIRLQDSLTADSAVGNSPYAFSFVRMPCPAEVENEMQLYRQALQEAMLGNASGAALQPVVQHRFVTYQWNETVALWCQLAAVLSLIFTLIVMLRTWNQRLLIQVNFGGFVQIPWMMCIGTGCLLSCTSVLIVSSGQMPDISRDSGYAMQDPLCDWEECALGEINDIFVSDGMCMAKDAAPSVSFVVIWASIIIMLRRTHVNLVLNREIGNRRLAAELVALISAQIAIKCHYYYTDPPQLHDMQEYLSGAVHPEPLNLDGEPLFPSNSTVHWRVNPHFYCYSGSAAKYWGIDAGYHFLLLAVAAMLAYINNTWHERDSYQGAQADKLNTIAKALNETGSVSQREHTAVPYVA